MQAQVADGTEFGVGESLGHDVGKIPGGSNVLQDADAVANAFGSVLVTNIDVFGATGTGNVAFCDDDCCPIVFVDGGVLGLRNPGPKRAHTSQTGMSSEVWGSARGPGPLAPPFQESKVLCCSWFQPLSLRSKPLTVLAC